MKDLEVWKKSRENLKVENIRYFLKSFSDLNLKYISYIKDFIESSTFSEMRYDLLEPGCGFGAGSFYLSNKLKNLNFTLLDYDEKLINDLRKVYNSLGKSFSFCYGNMFQMPFKDNSFDFIYNNGVLEHFNFEERLNIFKEHSRVLKKGGLMFVVIPNHYNIVYRCFYLLAKLLGRLKVPEEYGIYDFKKECSKNGLQFLKRKTFIENSLYGFLTLMIIKKP